MLRVDADQGETTGRVPTGSHPDDADFIEAIVQHAPAATAGGSDHDGADQVVELTGATVSYLPVSTRPTDSGTEPIEVPRRSDVDEWGRSEHMRSIVRRLY